MGTLSAKIAAEHPGESGFYILNSGVEAFAARIALIESARQTIDLQYYIIHGDDSGKMIIERLLAAADRGVRVRILVDDIYTVKADAKIAVLAVHPQVEIRLFNPWKYRGGGFSYAFNFLSDSKRLNHRMHNKLFVVDNAALIMGGRNLGDEYFGLNADFTFADLDVLGIGPVAAEASEHFDRYWNSEWAVPIAARRDLRPTQSDLDALRAQLAADRVALRDSRFGENAANTEFIREIKEHRIQLYYAPATVLADAPDKVVSNRKKDRAEFLMAQIRRTVPRAEKELLLCSPYFVPGKEGVHYLESMSTNGVDIRILTNAQEAGDVSVVHSGYAPYRVDLLRAGIHLYELKRVSDPSREKFASQKFGSANASLHTKCLISDRRHVFIGSLNLDPRSMERNTETGVIIESAEIGQKLGTLFERGIAPDASYRVVLEDGPNGSSSDLEWISTEGGQERRFKTEPGTTWFQRFKIKIMSLLPIESQI
ncbi:MAG TPA: phospholipase D family protein [Verrucomicrobiota bacterium]|nr:phospholipase D family protein [Verrucomicrobiota bacterium]